MMFCNLKHTHTYYDMYTFLLNIFGLTQLAWNSGRAGTKNAAGQVYQLMENPKSKVELSGC